MGRMSFNAPDHIEKRIREISEETHTTIGDVIAAAFGTTGQGGDTIPGTSHASIEGSSNSSATSNSSETPLSTSLDNQIKHAKLENLQTRTEYTRLKTFAFLSSLPKGLQDTAEQWLDREDAQRQEAEQPKIEDTRKHFGWCDNCKSFLFTFEEVDRCNQQGHRVPWSLIRKLD